MLNDHGFLVICNLLINEVILNILKYKIVTRHSIIHPLLNAHEKLKFIVLYSMLQIMITNVVEYILLPPGG